MHPHDTCRYKARRSRVYTMEFLYKTVEYNRMLHNDQHQIQMINNWLCYNENLLCFWGLVMMWLCSVLQLEIATLASPIQNTVFSTVYRYRWMLTSASASVLNPANTNKQLTWQSSVIACILTLAHSGRSLRPILDNGCLKKRGMTTMMPVRTRRARVPRDTVKEGRDKNIRGGFRGGTPGARDP